MSTKWLWRRRGGCALACGCPAESPATRASLLNSLRYNYAALVASTSQPPGRKAKREQQAWRVATESCSAAASAAQPMMLFNSPKPTAVASGLLEAYSPYAGGLPPLALYCGGAVAAFGGVLSLGRCISAKAAAVKTTQHTTRPDEQQKQEAVVEPLCFRGLGTTGVDPPCVTRLRLYSSEQAEGAALQPRNGRIMRKASIPELANESLAVRTTTDSMPSWKSADWEAEYSFENSAWYWWNESARQTSWTRPPYHSSLSLRPQTMAALLSDSPAARASQVDITAATTHTDPADTGGTKVAYSPPEKQQIWKRQRYQSRKWSRSRGAMSQSEAEAAGLLNRAAVLSKSNPHCAQMQVCAGSRSAACQSPPITPPASFRKS